MGDHGVTVPPPHSDPEWGTMESRCHPPPLKTFEISSLIVSNAIDKLPPKSAPGPDGLPNILLKQLKQELIPKLTIIFKTSIKTGMIPKQFLSAFVKPIKKVKKPRSDPASYRPVSLTSGLSKIMEHCIKPQVQKHLEDGNILSDAQHGFRPGRSCISQLLQHYSDVLSDLENGKTSDTIYLDFSKAFDSVDRHILGRQVKAAGITDDAGNWLFQFLSNREQRTIAENLISKPAEVRSGVPQGTVLGPILFLIMINSLTEEELTSRISMFADDTRISQGIKTEDDLITLQEDLDKLFELTNRNNMSFNGDKFDHVSHGGTFRGNRNIPKGEFVTDMNEVIEKKSSVRDLGIEITQETNFNKHISQICKKATEKINWIYRTFYSRDPEFLCFMWRSFVQPILDYGCQVWAPSDLTNLKKLEAIFKNYSARAQQHRPEGQKVKYWNRLIQYGLRSQQRRQDRFRIISVWKIMESLTPNCGLVWRKSDRAGRLCIIPPTIKTASIRVQTLREHSFQVKASNLFNSLPQILRDMTSCSLNQFKNQLDKFLDIIPDTPVAQKYIPAPTDRISAKPSNGLQEWIKYLDIQTRRETSLKDIHSSVNIKRSPLY